MAVKVKILSISLIGILLLRCAAVPPYRGHPALSEGARTIKTMLVLPPKVDVIEVDVQTTKKLPEASLRAKENLLSAIDAELKGRSALVVRSLSEVSLTEEAQSNLEESYALFDAVNASIRRHTYGPSAERFKDKIKDFDYSLGEEIKALRIGDADTLLLVRGRQVIVTTRLKAMAVALGVTLGLALLAFAAAGGPPVIPGGGIAEPPDMARLDLDVGRGLYVALVDANDGSILWYNRRESADLQEPANVARWVKQLFKDLPIQ